MIRLHQFSFSQYDDTATQAVKIGDTVHPMREGYVLTQDRCMTDIATNDTLLARYAEAVKSLVDGTSCEMQIIPNNYGSIFIAWKGPESELFPIIEEYNQYNMDYALTDLPKIGSDYFEMLSELNTIEEHDLESFTNDVCDGDQEMAGEILVTIHNALGYTKDAAEIQQQVA
jgi:hypothetical protein